MAKLKLNINPIKSIFLMLMVLYSFTPCSIKTVLFDAVDATYAKPISKSASTSQNSNCQDFSSVKQNGKSIGELQYANANWTPTAEAFSTEIVKLQPISREYSGKTSGNSPPMYILFKRLKIDFILST